MKSLHMVCGGSWGGGPAIVLAITKALIERGDIVWVVTANKEQTRRFEEAGATVFELGHWIYQIHPRDLLTFVQLFLLCRRERFDLVTTHTSKGGFIGRLAAELAGAPHIVHHAHGFAFRETQGHWTRRFYVLLERIAARACSVIISVSEDHRRDAIRERIAAAEKIVTILNGIEVGSFGCTSMQEARQKLGLETREPLIGVATRLAPKKGVEDMIQAFQEIHEFHPHARLVILGEGPSQMELKRQAQSTGLADRVHFAGFCRNVPELLAAFDIIAQPSISEGLSLAILEAMAAGKPVVACDIPGNREIITSGVNGILVPPSNPPALAMAFRSLLDNSPYACKLGKTAQTDCRKRFSQDRMVRQTLSLYDALLMGHPIPVSEQMDSLQGRTAQGVDPAELRRLSKRQAEKNKPQVTTGELWAK
jgi:glycosyltransferase involved in cell wall biosynthesis